MSCIEIAKERTSCVHISKERKHEQSHVLREQKCECEDAAWEASDKFLGSGRVRHCRLGSIYSTSKTKYTYSDSN